MTSAIPKRAGRGPPVLRIHSGASHPCRGFEASCLDQGLIAAPGPR